MSRYTRQEDKEIYVGKIIGNSIGLWKVVKKEHEGIWTLQDLNSKRFVRGIYTSTIESIMREGRKNDKIR